MFGFLSRSKKPTPAPVVVTKRRSYMAAQNVARYGDITASRGSADYELANSLSEVRAKARFLAPGTHQRADAKGKGNGQGALPAKGPTKTTKARATEPASSAEDEAFAAGDLVLIPL